MKVEPVRGPKFASVVRKHGSAPLSATPVLAGHDSADPLAILLTNYLLWESSHALAEEALARLSRVVVDANELRVMLEGEVTEAIGEKYPFVEERSRRLRATLNDIFRRQHRTSLDHLRNASRKDQRAYIEGLAEIPPFVAGRTLTVAFELPSPFVDDTTVELLHQQGVVEPTVSTLEVSQWIAKHHRLEELGKVNAALSALNAEGWSAAGKNPTKIRAAYLARHAEFRAVEQAERQRVEDEKREKALAIERAAEAKRLAEVAREEERIRQKREAEEARIRARADREAARIAAVAAREKARVEREAAQLRREAERARQAEVKRRAAEREAEKRAKAAAKRAKEDAKRKARAIILARKAAERVRIAKARKLALAKKQAMQRKLALARKAALSKKLALRKQMMLAKRAAIARRAELAREVARKVAARKKLELAKKQQARKSAKKSKPTRRPASLAKKSAGRKARPSARKASGRAKQPKRGR